MSRGQLQVIYCKCGESIAACIVPECYEDADWQKEMRKAITKQGATVGFEDTNTFKFGTCRCHRKKSNKHTKPELFS